MSQFLQELGELSPATLAVIVALAGAIGVIVAAIVTAVLGRLIVSPFLGARDQQDKEVEWRKHAIELTKLDVEQKLRTRSPTDFTPLRPSILGFLANYRDLQELGAKTPKELYLDIQSKRIIPRSSGAEEQHPSSTVNPTPAADETPAIKSPDSQPGRPDLSRPLTD